tara:strand:+ start:127 stop:504 length:378 start_codon:yes stop_codon:yes gene_type:complete
MKNKKRNIIVIICVLFVGYIIYNYNNDSKYIKLEKSKLEYYLNCSDYLELTGDTCERLKHDFEGGTLTLEPIEFEPFTVEPHIIELSKPIEPIEPRTYIIEPLIKLDEYTPNRNYDYSPQTQEVQ